MPIFDQGYQHWQGSLRGYGWRWLAIARHGIRGGMQNRFLRIVIILAWVPALMLAGVISLWGMVEQKSPWAMSALTSLIPVEEFLSNPAAFRVSLWTLCFYFFIHIEMCFVLIVVLMVGPGLISQDLRFNALPLYFSRPVRRIDYFLGKLGVIGFFLFLVAVVPAVAAWFFGVLFSLDFGVVVDTARILLGVVLYGVVVTLSAGLLMLALSSLSRNSRYVGGIWAGFCLLTLFVFGMLEGMHYDRAIRRQGELHMRHPQHNRRALNDRERVGMPPDPPDDREARKRIKEELEEDFRNDWRPCVSYTHNLMRFGDALLGYYDARDRLDELLASARRARFKQAGGGPDLQDDTELYVQRLEPRWPWYWSGIVLVALGGLSVWILNRRVRTLDRLR